MIWWSAHTHSRYSAQDALPYPAQMVAKAVKFNQPALGLTDHGNMAGSAQLYTAARKAGIEPLPGTEAYVTLNRETHPRNLMHLGLLATTGLGYRNLVGLSTQSHRQFHYKPILDLADLAAAADDGRLEGIACMTGCWFGLLPALLRNGDPNTALNVLSALEGWFNGNVYVELQHHGIHDATHNDTAHVAVLHDLAIRAGLPVVITQDAHYCEPDERRVHDTLKQLVSWSDDPDDAMFPGDGYHMVDGTWMASRYTAAQLADGLEGLDVLLGKARVVIPELDTFHMVVPDTGGDPDDVLRLEVVRALAGRQDTGAIKVTHHKKYAKRAADELDVVIPAGFSGYLMLAKAVCDELRRRRITFFVRGSGSGSLLLWLLGITSLDPIAWDLPFDRFLSTDRTKPPDIDIDIEHERRDEMIEWLDSHYHTSHISTWMKMGLSTDENGDQKGSLLVRWKTLQRKVGGDPTARIPDHEYATLETLSSYDPLLSYGVHPAGIMITPDEATAACIPLAYVASSKTLVTQYAKKDVERMGRVKLDMLGLRTLTALRIAIDLTGVPLVQVPFTDANTFKLIRSGRTTGMFQLEGSATQRGVRQLRPTTIRDLVAAMALFRPATLASGATESFIARRRGEEPVPVRHQIITEQTKATYGVLLYQEQALNVMKALGLTVEEVEAARDAIKASNEHVGNARKVLEELRVKIRRAAVQAGMVSADVSWLDMALDAYAGYGFNKAHATGYGVLAYFTAYYRANHPVAFWAGMLYAFNDSPMKTWYGDKGHRLQVTQVEAYTAEARKDGVQLLSPHVNRSKQTWTADVDAGAIRAGLRSLKGLGPVAADELVAHAPYASLDDLARKVAPRRVTGSKALGQGHSPMACGGVIAILSHAGALKGLEHEKEKTA